MAKTLKSLETGTTLVVPGSKHNGVPPVLRKLADNHHARGTTLLDTRDIIDLIPFDAREDENSDWNRTAFGNNNYSVSNIRKYLNSVGPNWYTPQHSQDAPPSAINITDGGAYYERNGFLSAFPSEFIERIVTTTLTTMLPNVDGGGRSTQEDKVFLLSRTELSGDNTEGKAIPFFINANYFRKRPTQEALNNNTVYKDPNLKTSEVWHWLTRSAQVSAGYRVYMVERYGNQTDPILSYSGMAGLSPALNLPSDTLVSDAPNAEGHYEIILSSPIGAPKIKIGTENKEILEMYLKVDGSNKRVIETHISINGTNKPWV